MFETGIGISLYREVVMFQPLPTSEVRQPYDTRSATPCSNTTPRHLDDQTPEQLQGGLVGQREPFMQLMIRSLMIPDPYSSESSESYALLTKTMDHLFAQATPVVMFLLPGFVSALIFYGLTSHPKPAQFERTVEALVFTFVIHVAAKGIEISLIAAGRFHSVGVWDSDAQVFWSVGLAAALGTGLAALANKYTVHSWLRRKGFTSRTSHPSEWFSVLGSTSSYLVLNLHDGRRLTGWPKEWPVTPDRGQFYLQEPAWIDENNNAVDLDTLDGILINATEVRWVEIHLTRERS